MRDENVVQAGSTRGPIRDASHASGVPLATTPGVLPNEDSKKTDVNRQTADGAGESARASRGKIARLPKHIREELNRRMDDGEAGSSLAKWLNELPIVKKALAKYFGGAAIIEKNISNWRTGGFKRWEERQELLGEIRELAEEAEDFSRAAGERFARGTASIAALKILKMLHAIKPEDCTPGELSKVAFAITALAQVEHANERLKLEKTRVYQGNERLVLSWDKHLRGCVATAQRVMDDEMAHDIQHSDIDNSQKIELLGHYLFKDRWVGRTHGPIASPDAPLETKPDDLPNKVPRQADDGTNGTEGTGPKEEKNIEQKETKVTEEAQDSGLNDSPSSRSLPLGAHACGGESSSDHEKRTVAVVPADSVPAEPEAKPTADAQVRPTVTHVGPAVVGEKSDVSAVPEANPLADARGSVATSADTQRSAPPKSRAALEEEEEWARICRRSREVYASLVASGATQKPKSPPPNPLYAPPPDQPQPGQTTPLYGPCEPPLTSASLRNLW